MSFSNVLMPHRLISISYRQPTDREKEKTRNLISSSYTYLHDFSIQVVTVGNQNRGNQKSAVSVIALRVLDNSISSFFWFYPVLIYLEHI